VATKAPAGTAAAAADACAGAGGTAAAATAACDSANSAGADAVGAAAACAPAPVGTFVSPVTAVHVSLEGADGAGKAVSSCLTRGATICASAVPAPRGEDGGGGREACTSDLLGGGREACTSDLLGGGREACTSDLLGGGREACTSDLLGGGGRRAACASCLAGGGIRAGGRAHAGGLLAGRRVCWTRGWVRSMWGGRPHSIKALTTSSLCLRSSTPGCSGFGTQRMSGVGAVNK